MDAGGGYPIYQQQQQPQHQQQHIHHPNLQQRRNVNLQNLLQNQPQFGEQNAYLTNPNFGNDAPPKPAVLSRLRSRMEKYRHRTQEQSLRYDPLFQKESDEQNKEALTLQKQAMDSKAKKTKSKSGNNTNTTTSISTTNTDKQLKGNNDGNNAVQMQHSIQGHMPQRNMKRAIEDVENEPNTLEPPTKLPSVDIKQQPLQQQQQLQSSQDLSDAAADISGQFSDFPEFLTNDVNPHDNTFNDLINDLQDINPEFLESSMIGKSGADSSLLDILDDVKSLEGQDFSIPPSPTQKKPFNINPSSNGIVNMPNGQQIPNQNVNNRQHPVQFPGTQQNRMPTNHFMQQQNNPILQQNMHLNQNGHPQLQRPNNMNQQGIQGVQIQQKILPTPPQHQQQQPQQQQHQQQQQHNPMPMRPQMSQTIMQRQMMHQQQVPIPPTNNPNQRMQFQQNMPINRQQQMNFLSQRNGLQPQGPQMGQQQQTLQPNMQPQLQNRQQQQMQGLQVPNMQQQQSQQNPQQYSNSVPIINRQGLPIQRVPNPQMNQIPIQQQIPQSRILNQQMGYNQPQQQQQQQQQVMGNRMIPQQTAQQRPVPMPNTNPMAQMHQNGSLRQPINNMNPQQQMIPQGQQQIIRNPMIRQQMMNQPHPQQQPPPQYPHHRMGQVPMQRNPNQMQQQQPVINNQQNMVMNRAVQQQQQQGMMAQQQGMLSQQQQQQQMQTNQRMNQMQQQQFMQQQNMPQQQQHLVNNNVGNNGQNMGLDFLDSLPMGPGNDMSAHDLLNSLGNDNFIDFLP